MYETIGFFSLIGVGVIFFIKFINVINNGKFYENKYSWVTFVMGVLLYLAYFISLWTSIGYVEIINDNGNITYISNNQYNTIVNYSYIVYLLFLLIGIFTIIEQIIVIPQYILPRKNKQNTTLPKY